MVRCLSTQELISKDLQMATLALMMGPVHDGWAVFLTNGREVARFRGLGARRRALRFLVRAAQ